MRNIPFKIPRRNMEISLTLNFSCWAGCSSITWCGLNRTLISRAAKTFNGCFKASRDRRRTCLLETNDVPPETKAEVTGKGSRYLFRRLEYFSFEYTSCHQKRQSVNLSKFQDDYSLPSSSLSSSASPPPDLTGAVVDDGSSSICFSSAGTDVIFCSPPAGVTSFNT